MNYIKMTSENPSRMELYIWADASIEVNRKMILNNKEYQNPHLDGAEIAKRMYRAYIGKMLETCQPDTKADKRIHAIFKMYIIGAISMKNAGIRTMKRIGI